VIGWSHHNHIYAKQQSIRHEDFGGDNFDYLVQTKNEGFHILPPKNCDYGISKKELPRHFAKQGICHRGDVSHNILLEVENFIKRYSHEIFQIGLTDEVLTACSPLIEADTREIICRTVKETSRLRSLCLANLGVKQDPCFETIYNRADALRWAGFFDEAAKEVKKAHQLKPSDSQTIGLGIQVCILRGDYDQARQYRWLLSEKDIVEVKSDILNNCIDFLERQLEAETL